MTLVSPDRRAPEFSRSDPWTIELAAAAFHRHQVRYGQLRGWDLAVNRNGLPSREARKRLGIRNLADAKGLAAGYEEMIR